MLAASGRVCRECGVQTPLLRLLCQFGADPAAAMHGALAHGELEAARVLIECGAPLDLPAAATLNDQEAVEKLAAAANEDQLQMALALAANAGRAGIVKTLLDVGADPNRYNPPGAHSHCTPLHSAVASDQFNTVISLVDGDTDLDLKDIHHKMTALEWAVHLKRERIADFLGSRK